MHTDLVRARPTSPGRTAAQQAGLRAHLLSRGSFLWPGAPRAALIAALSALLVTAGVSQSVLPSLAPQVLLLPPSDVLVAPPGQIAVWQTAAAGQRLAPVSDLRWVPCAALHAHAASAAPCAAKGAVVRVDPAVRYQTIAGFGGAFNERGWAALLTLPAQTRNSVIESLFSVDSGAGFSLARTPIGASDYALTDYSLDSVRGDLTLQHFSIARDRLYLLPYIRSALQVAPDLTVWASPWSAPDWMKSNDSMTHGGELLPQYEGVYARYFADFVQAYAREGVNIAAVSVQNEPTRAPKYPSMLMPASQMARFVGNDLGPLFNRLGLRTTIRVNEGPSPAHWTYSVDVLADAAALKFTAGSDIHGYYDSVANLDRLHRAYPQLDIWQTEDMNLDHPHYEYADALRWAAQIAGDLQHWIAGWDFWNMVTDQTGMSTWGWRQDTVVVVDTGKHVVSYTPKFAAIAQFSRFIRPGARRIGLSGVPKGITATAALDSDGRKVLVVVNSGRTRTSFTLISEGRQSLVTVPPQAIVTYVWR